MAVAIRLKRFGKKKKPVYRVVVADQRKARDGETIEDIGHYNPSTKTTAFSVNEERVKYWISVGAQPTKPVKRLLAGLGLVDKPVITSSQQNVAKKERKKSDS